MKKGGSRQISDVEGLASMETSFFPMSICFNSVFIDHLPTLDGVLTLLGSALLGEKLWLLFTGVLGTTWEGTVGSGDLLLGVLDIT